MVLFMLFVYFGTTGNRWLPVWAKLRDIRDARRRDPAAGQGLPCCNAEEGPLRSRWVEPAAAGGGVDPPSQEWEALSGEQE